MLMFSNPLALLLTLAIPCACGPGLQAAAPDSDPAVASTWLPPPAHCLAPHSGFTDGEWARDGADGAPPDPALAAIRAAWGPEWGASPSLDWAWRPRDPRCALAPVSRARACATLHAMGVTVVLVVGDSIQGHLFESITTLLAASPTKNNHKGYTEYKVRCGARPAADGAASGGGDMAPPPPPKDVIRFIYVRDDRLTGNVTYSIDGGGKVSLEWPRELLPTADLVVASAGPHFHSVRDRRDAPTRAKAS